MSASRQSISRAFGEALRAERKAKGLSQERFAERVGIDRTTPSLFERGLRGPTLAMLIDVGKALGIEPTQLVIATLDRLRETELISDAIEVPPPQQADVATNELPTKDHRQPSKDLVRRIAWNVQRFRHGLGLTQDQLAKRCGCKARFISTIETAQATNVTLATIEMLANGLDYPESHLLLELRTQSGGNTEMDQGSTS